jgi:hypothetical protein
MQVGQWAEESENPKENCVPSLGFMSQNHDYVAKNTKCLLLLLVLFLGGPENPNLILTLLMFFLSLATGFLQQQK